MNELKLGTHAIAINNNAEGFEDDELSGFMFSYQRNISEYVALRGGLYIDEHDDNSKLEASGIESHILVGNNFTGKGFYGSGGLGFFSETWEYDDTDIDFDFSGFLVSAGIGYRWEAVVLDFIINLRDPGDYEDKINDILGSYYQDSIDVVAASGSLSIGIRF
jgi:hypothetical protein